MQFFIPQDQADFFGKRRKGVVVQDQFRHVGLLSKGIDGRCPSDARQGIGTLFVKSV
jgi:hypothetical protein